MTSEERKILSAVKKRERIPWPDENSREGLADEPRQFAGGDGFSANKSSRVPRPGLARVIPFFRRQAGSHRRKQHPLFEGATTREKLQKQIKIMDLIAGNPEAVILLDRILGMIGAIEKLNGFIEMVAGGYVSGVAMDRIIELLEQCPSQEFPAEIFVGIPEQKVYWVLAHLRVQWKAAIVMVATAYLPKWTFLLRTVVKTKKSKKQIRIIRLLGNKPEAVLLLDQILEMVDCACVALSRFVIVASLWAAVAVIANAQSATTKGVLAQRRSTASPAGSTAVWQHSDVYETTVTFGGTEYRCTIVVKGDEAQVTIESRTRASVGVTANGKTVTFEGHTQQFTIERLPGGGVEVGPSTWTNDAEAEDGVRYRLIAKRGPPPQQTLQTFADALTELPVPVAGLFTDLIKPREKK